SFDRQDERLARALAAHAGAVLAVAEAVTRERTRREREALVAAISAHLRVSLEPDAVLRTAVADLGPALGADRCFISLGTPERPQVLTHEWSAEGVSSTGSDVPLPTTLIELAIRERRVVASTDVAA